MKYFFHITFSVLFLSGVLACTKKPGKSIGNIIDKDKMTMVLVDVHLAEASTEARTITPQMIDRIASQRYKSVFTKHEITLQQFQDSYDYYLEHSELLNEIYIEVVNRLSQMDSKYSTKQKKTLNVRDSLVVAPILQHEKK